MVFSTHHPFMDEQISRNDDYFGTYTYIEEWRRFGGLMTMRFWHRPLRAMLAAVRAAGFTVDEIVEPQPAPEMAATHLDAYRHLTRKAQFLLFSLTRD